MSDINSFNDNSTNLKKIDSIEIRGDAIIINLLCSCCGSKGKQPKIKPTLTGIVNDGRNGYFSITKYEKQNSNYVTLSSSTS